MVRKEERDPLRVIPLFVMALFCITFAPRLAGAGTVERPDPGESELAYHFQLETAPELGVWVELVSRGADTGRTVFVVSRSWGGVDTGGEDIHDVTVRDARGRELAVLHPEPHRWQVAHSPGERLTVRWRFAATPYQADSSPDVNRRPILNPGLFHIYGELGLLVPDHLDVGVSRPVSLSWGGFAEAGWKQACSFSVGADPCLARTSLQELRESVFLAGDFELLEKDIRGRPLWIAVAGEDWGFENAAFADLAASILGLERAFFADDDYPFFLITVIPVGSKSPGSRSIGGTGLTNSFSLEMLPGTGLEGGSVDAGVARILAHEMFHNWNGRFIPREDPEELVYWFSEGFTDFYARRLLYRGGLIAAEDYAASLRHLLSDLYLSPVLNAPNERILSDFWRDPAVQRLPYQRGDVVALILDRAIRRDSGGSRSLDSLMCDLVRAGRDRGEKITTASLLARFAAETDSATSARIGAIVESGVTPAIDPATLEPCLELRMEDVPPYDLGFDFAASRETHRICGVRPDSPAARAGLRDGQELIGWSTYGNDVTREASFRVRENGAEREFAYLPAGVPQSVPQFYVRPEAPAALCRER